MSQIKIDLAVLNTHLNYADQALKNADAALGALAMQYYDLGPSQEEFGDLISLIKSFRRKLDQTIKTKIY